MAQELPPVLVLYGSQTGTAAETALRLGRALRRLHVPHRVRAMDAADIDVRSLPSLRYLLCVCSTTGQGQAPDNMRLFWRYLLRRGLPAHSLSRLRFAVFGLGDSTYPKFNFVAKKLHARLLDLGAAPLVELGLADERHVRGIDGAFEPWLFQVTTALLQHFPPPAPPLPSSSLLPPSLPLQRLPVPATAEATADLQENYTSSETNGHGGPQTAPGHDRPSAEPTQPTAGTAAAAPSRLQPFAAPLLQNQRMTPSSHFQDVRHVIVDIRSCPQLHYNAGDVAYIMVRS